MPPQSRDSPLTDRLLSWAYDLGVTSRIADLRGDALTVVCYHRIGDVQPGRFHGFTPNISASAEGLERQIEHLSKHFTLLSVSELIACLDHPRQLPRRPALVTFDDGYKDNGDVAWPILRQRKVPAVVFLATDHIGTGRPFVWDFAAYCFHHTARDMADVPLLGPTPLRTQTDRRTATESWVERSKSFPASERWTLAHTMRQALDVTVSGTAFSDLYLSWDDVRRLASEGLEFGGHTRTHPILTTLTMAQAREEIIGCYRRIGAELGRPPAAFAYPNGSRTDFTHEHEVAVRASGYSVAFSLEPGPTSLARSRRRPTAIRRIYVGRNDDMPRFTAKLAGAWQLGTYLRRCSADWGPKDRNAAAY